MSRGPWKSKMRKQTMGPESIPADVTVSESIPVDASGCDPYYFYQDGGELPKFYERKPLQPCPKCRRIRTDMASQCARCTSVHESIAYFYCAVCGHRWELPIRESK